MGAAQPRNLAPAVRLTGAGPSGLAWKINRLRVMTPAEIGHRLARAAAMRIERWGLVRSEVPAPDLAIRARPWIHADARVDFLPYVAAAERVAAGVHDIFALEGVDLGRIPRWNRDPRTGVEAPLAFGKQLDYRDERVVGDCKYLWEPNRHLHFVTLAQAWKLTGEARYAEVLLEHLESWIAACPYKLGPNWASALEPAMRLVNWAFAWQLLGGVDSPVFASARGQAMRAAWLASVYQHAEFVNGHYSRHSSANNHLVGEATGVFVASLAWPHWPRARRWHADARAILEREALLQNAPDGVNREQATSYAAWTFDLLLIPLLAARANGQDFPAEYVDRLESMLEFLASIMDVAGHVPMIGDSDDGIVARLDPRRGFCRFHSQLATGALLFGRADFRAKAGALDDKTRWLVGGEADARYEALVPHSPRLPMRRAFPEGGYYILGGDFETPGEIRIVADAGPLGYREIAAHGHADALAFTLSVGGREMLVDPGTYAYHTQAAWRAYFRGTSAHNTVRIDGCDQSEQGGNFLWLRKARTRVSAWMSSVDRDLLEASHDGYAALPDPVIHQRRLTFDKRSRVLAIEDHLRMKGAHEVELFFHAAEDCIVEPVAGGVAIHKDGVRLYLRWPERLDGDVQLYTGCDDPIAGWVSRRFDHKVPAPTLVWRARLAGDTLLRTTLDIEIENRGQTTFSSLEKVVCPRSGS